MWALLWALWTWSSRVREAAAKPVKGPNNLLQRRPLHACRLQSMVADGQRAVNGMRYMRNEDLI